MANPRQRRKARSSSHKAVKLSRRAKKIQKKQPPIRGPKVLQDAWDSGKTVRQNYELLGLAHSLNPHDSGGNERSCAHSTGTTSENTTGAGSQLSADKTGIGGIPTGFGRIRRDAEGNVVEIELGEEDADGSGEQGDSPMEDDEALSRGVRRDTAASGWLLSNALSRDGPQSEAVKTLEDSCVASMSAHASAGTTSKTPRTASAGELRMLGELVGAHGEDVEAMALDRKRNAGQRTAGQLRRRLQQLGLVLGL